MAMRPVVALAEISDLQIPILSFDADKRIRRSPSNMMVHTLQMLMAHTSQTLRSAFAMQPWWLAHVFSAQF